MAGYLNVMAKSYLVRPDILLDVEISVAKDFCRRTHKGPLKNLRGWKNWRLNFYQICQKRAKKRPNFFKPLVCGSSEMNAFLVPTSDVNVHKTISFLKLNFQFVSISKRNEFFYPYITMIEMKIKTNSFKNH
jgi:hypothetical protein